MILFKAVITKLAASYAAPRTQVVSCSQFEAHAGRGARRAPYDFIFTEEGLSLRRLAERLPALEGEAAGAPLVARKVSWQCVGSQGSHLGVHI